MKKKEIVIYEEFEICTFGQHLHVARPLCVVVVLFIIHNHHQKVIQLLLETVCLKHGGFGCA